MVGNRRSFHNYNYGEGVKICIWISILLCF